MPGGLVSLPPATGERFVLELCLGTGAAGTVYRAFDRTRGATVALKILTQVDPGSLFRFKGEFRALSDLAHPNLVRLYELITHDDQWLLTMELVEGSDFLGYVRPEQPGASASEESSVPSHGSKIDASVDDDTVAVVTTEPLIADTSERMTRPAAPRSRRVLGALDPVRLRSALRQLCEGLHALHATGRLHCDLKPANVLVFDADGRVAICDFGLVVEAAKEQRNEDGDDLLAMRARGTRPRREIAGTIAFMSPEQGTRGRLTKASDWYAVGVMLYQALTRQLPFPRLPMKAAIRAKLERVPAHPRELCADAPEDLADLAIALLNPEPTARPGYAEVVAALEGRRKRISLGPRGLERLFGRRAQLAELRDAFERTLGGMATVTFVSGPSGMGKSALVQHFLAGLEQRCDALVLTARCYEREELPHKAFDPLMDALTSHLLDLDERTVEELLPEGVQSLARLFPVLRRVKAIERFEGEAPATLSPVEQKRRAFVAFREICRRLSLRRPLVLYMDDLQWGDLDSGPLFTELLRHPQPPAILVLCAYRSEDENRSELLDALRTKHLPDAGITDPIDVEVHELNDTDSRELAGALLSDVAAADEAAELVVREAGGSPFFVHELASYIRARGTEAASKLQLGTLIEARVNELTQESRALLAAVAVAGRPERRAILQAATRLGERHFAALQLLEVQRLVQSTGLDADDRIETYHDRIRETVYRLIGDEERTRLHRELAVALETERERDAEALLGHWRQAGEPKRAGEYALLAAQRAEAALAFGRAVSLYGEALALLRPEGELARSLEERLGHALVAAGRGADAAQAFFRALPGAAPQQAMQLHSLATTQLMRAGRIAEAFAELKRAEGLFGVDLPESDGAAIAMLLWRRLRITLRGRRLRLRPPGSVPAQTLHRLDMLWDVASALVNVDLLRGAVYSAELTLRAFDAGDPYRLSCALMLEAALSAAANKRPERTQWAIDRALEMAGISGEPRALAIAKGSISACRMLEARWRESIRLAVEAQSILRDQLGAALSWDLALLVTFELQCISNVGDVQQLVTRVPEVLREAEARGDLFAATLYRTWRNSWAWLGIDQPEVARRQADIAESQWTPKGFQFQHWYTTYARAEADLYCDTPDPSIERVARDWNRSFFLHQVQFTRSDARYLRARLQLAKARQRYVPQLIARVRSDAKVLIRERTPWTLAIGRLLLACAASFSDRAQASTLLGEVEGQFLALDMPLHAAVARWRKGELTGGADGASAIGEAEGRIRWLGVVRPERFVRMLAPGFPGPEAHGNARSI
jgi:eukaryotic-like serine/threonine-protein kinase